MRPRALHWRQSFSIRLLPDLPTMHALRALGYDAARPYRSGEIAFSAEEHEQFLLPVDYWSEEAYVAQWQEGLLRTVEGSTRSCLITSISDPGHLELTRWWALYRLDDVVVFEEHLIEPEDMRHTAPGTAPYDLVGESHSNEVTRVALTIGGTEIDVSVSHWHVPIADVETFLESQAEHRL